MTSETDRLGIGELDEQQLRDDQTHGVSVHRARRSTAVPLAVLVRVEGPLPTGTASTSARVERL